VKVVEGRRVLSMGCRGCGLSANHCNSGPQGRRSVLSSPY
jgi:hypothetical protein